VVRSAEILEETPLLYGCASLGRTRSSIARLQCPQSRESISPALGSPKNRPSTMRRSQCAMKDRVPFGPLDLHYQKIRHLDPWRWFLQEEEPWC